MCNFPGCKSVLVLDGNMKNRRDVCAASEAGFIEYESLPGAIKSGCQFSPGYQSKYCHEHAPRISQRTIAEDQASGHSEAGVVKLITAKKQTRKETYYQVYTRVTTLPYLVVLGQCAMSNLNFLIFLTGRTPLSRKIMILHILFPTNKSNT